MNKTIAIFICLLLNANLANANQSTLLPEPVLAALSQELSGETAKRNLEYIARQHRMRGSRGFRAAAEHIVEQLRDYGLTDARIEQFPADGKIFYGTQKSRPAWDAEFAELWELRETTAGWTPHTRLASWDAMPISLAQDSESGEVTAELVDVGNGTSERDYAGKDVRGKIVLAAAQPGPVARLAVETFGAAGIVSYAQNQRTAWWGENENLVRWGHLETFAAKPTFAFMISLKQARDFQQTTWRAERRFDFTRQCAPENIPASMMSSRRRFPAPTHACATKRSLSVVTSITSGPARTTTRAAASPYSKSPAPSAS